MALALSRSVAAQPVTVDARARSLSLFQEAQKLAAAGDSAAACRKYGESYSLAPELDALLSWADCLERGGKPASAYLAFRDAVELAERTFDARSAAAEARARALRPRLSYLTVEVLPERAVAGLMIERDGFRLGSSAWGLPLPIDPGSHSISVSAPGYQSWTTTVEVAGDGAAPFVEVPKLASALHEPAPVAPVAPIPVAAPEAPPSAPLVVAPPVQRASGPDDRVPRGTTNVLRIAAPVLVGVGVVGTAAGFYFWGETRSTLDERDGICPTSRDCEPGTNARLADLTSQAVTSRRSQIICFALGGTAAAIGVGLWLLPTRKGSEKGRAARITAVAQPGGGGLLLQGEL